MTEAADSSVGDALRRARQARGLSIAEVAQQLKFAPRQLEALEDDRFDALPGATITRGMVRNYARLLKLDPEPLVAQAAERLKKPDTGQLAARYTEPVPFSDGGRRTNIVYVSLSVVILLVVGGIALEWYRERNAPAPMAFVSPGSKPAPQPPVEASRASVSASPPSSASAEAPAKEPDAEPTREKPAPSAAVAEKPAPAAEEPRERKPPAGTHRLVFRFEREAWIEVRDGAERLLLAQLAPEGAERVVQGRAPITLVVGNAQHVRITMDGKPVDLKRHTRNDVARFQLP